jgi:abhydrolase domain-containing protein 12
VSRVLVHKFDSLKAVKNITASVLIAHAEDDWDIPSSHSDVLFQAYLDPLLPDLNVPDFGPKVLSAEEWNHMAEQRKARQVKRAEIVEHTEVPHFGSLDEFEQGDRTVTLVKTHKGGHDYLPLQEGVQDIVKKKFNM